MTASKRDVATCVTDRADVYRAIDTERTYQDDFLDDEWATHTVGEFILMLEHYVDQARDNLVKHREDDSGRLKCLHDVRKVAAIAVRCMEQHGAIRRRED